MSASADVWAIVPVKPFAVAKRRLAPVMRAAERAHLARLMLEDVLDALAHSAAHLAGIVVVTADENAGALAAQRDAKVVSCDGRDGINAAIRLGADRAMRCGGGAVLIAPSDIPQLTPHGVAEAVDAIGTFGTLALLSATRDGGTNLLACRPATALPLHFGPGSFKKHCASARRDGMHLRVLPPGDLGLDVDRPDDLADLLSLQSKTRTHAYLSRLTCAPAAWPASP